jgi:hypothetical protein
MAISTSTTNSNNNGGKMYTGEKLKDAWDEYKDENEGDKFLLISFILSLKKDFNIKNAVDFKNLWNAYKGYGEEHEELPKFIQDLEGLKHFSIDDAGDLSNLWNAFKMDDLTLSIENFVVTLNEAAGFSVGDQNDMTNLLNALRNDNPNISEDDINEILSMRDRPSPFR